MKHDVGLAALIVNYNTGSYALCCVESLLHEWEREGRSRDKLQVVLIDNASPEDQEPWLCQIEDLGVEVIRSKENLGYAGGLNRCYERTTGEPGDAVALLNPDIHFLPGTIEKLIDYIFDHPDVGVVDPNACIDALGTFHLPRNLLPTPMEHCRLMLAHMHPFFARRYSRMRLKKTMEWWTASDPIEADMLSGCCLFMRRAVVDEMGHPMDERYPLYFEDTDLFRTLRQMGYKVVHHGGALILHHWSRSAKIASPDSTEPTERYEVSRRLYAEKFFSPLGRLFVKLVDLMAFKWPKDKLNRPMMPLADIGDWEKPLELQLPRSCRYLIELSIQPNFVICCGVFGQGDRWVCEPESWEWFFPLEYYARAIDLDTGEVLGGYRFRRVGMCRTEAMRHAEVAAYGDRLLSLSPARSA